ncbi:MAG: sulfatase-like hydrolase/transferase, partial [Desulfobacterales bacterium]|nr:sulfatase-like hydrolase/transferase [Desulfobacterales bacterium]
MRKAPRDHVVLLIVIDTLRQDHVGCYGYHRDTTPFIDRLAAQGRSYSRAFSPAPITLPAHVCIFTSRYPGWNGVGIHNSSWFPPVTTWVAHLNRAGILTAGFVSSFVLDRRMTRGFDFHHYDDLMTGVELNRDAPRRRTKETVDVCLRWFEQVPRGVPVFCFLHLMDVHPTYDVNDSIAGRFVQDYSDEETLPLCQVLEPGGIPDIYRLDKMPDFPGKHVGAYYVDRYDGSISYVDREIQRLMTGMAEIHAPSLTCLITSDHGEAFGEDDYWCSHSHTVLPNQTQIPLVLWSSDSDRLADLIGTSRPVSLLDLGPTVLELFGGKKNFEDRHHGWSLFGRDKPWDTRRLFSISFTQILAYHAEDREGCVIGSPTVGIPFTYDVDKRSPYFGHESRLPSDSFTEGILFSDLARSFGPRLRPILASYFEKQERDKMARQLAELGYLGHEPSDEGSDGIESFLAPFPPLQGALDLDLPRPRAERLARELQVRPALDLGCGSNKAPGFFGADRFPLPGVDIILNLNRPLPFGDNTFDLIVARHSLEHVTDLMFTMKEIYRVCKHGAQVCIVAPYYQQGLNLANPYHKQIFNEHSPRFWTNQPNTVLDPAEYCHPHAGVWGLSETDHSAPGIDLRCLRMDFFYFPEYRHLSSQEQRSARKKFLDVCDEIVYHLVAVKEPIKETEMQELAKTTEYYEPPLVMIRRLQERCESFETEMNRLRSRLDQAKASLLERDTELTHLRAASEAAVADLRQIQAALEARKTELTKTEAALQSCEKGLKELRAKGNSAVHELD